MSKPKNAQMQTFFDEKTWKTRQKDVSPLHGFHPAINFMLSIHAQEANNISPTWAHSSWSVLKALKHEATTPISAMYHNPLLDSHAYEIVNLLRRS